MEAGSNLTATNTPSSHSVFQKQQPQTLKGRQHRQSLLNLHELFKKNDDEVHLLFPKDITQFRKNKIASIAIKIKKRFSLDSGIEEQNYIKSVQINSKSSRTQLPKDLLELKKCHTNTDHQTIKTQTKQNYNINNHMNLQTSRGDFIYLQDPYSSVNEGNCADAENTKNLDLEFNNLQKQQENNIQNNNINTVNMLATQRGNFAHFNEKRIHRLSQEKMPQLKETLNQAVASMIQGNPSKILPKVNSLRYLTNNSVSVDTSPIFIKKQKVNKILKSQILNEQVNQQNLDQIKSYMIGLQFNQGDNHQEDLNSSMENIQEKIEHFQKNEFKSDMKYQISSHQNLKQKNIYQQKTPKRESLQDNKKDFSQTQYKQFDFNGNDSSLELTQQKKLRASVIDLSPLKNQNKYISPQKSSTSKHIQEYIQHYKYKLGIKDQEKANFEVIQLNDRVKQWKQKRRRFNFAPDEACMLQQLEIQEQLLKNRNTQGHAGSTAASSSLGNNNNNGSKQSSSNNFSYPETKTQKMKNSKAVNFLQKVESQKIDLSFTQQKTPVPAQLIDLIKIPKFQSQNVSMVSYESSRNVSPVKQSADLNSMRLPLPEEYSQYEQQLLERLQDGIKLNGQGSFIHNTLKSIYRRTSIKGLDDIKNMKVLSQDKTPTGSPSKLIQNQARDTLFGFSQASRKQSLFFPKNMNVNQIPMFQKD
eukprot:403365935